MASDVLNRKQQYSVGVLGLSGIFGLFVFIREALVGQLSAGALSTGELFTLAFLAGAWSAMVIIFSLNQLGHRRWGGAAVKLKPLK